MNKLIYFKVHLETIDFPCDELCHHSVKEISSRITSRRFLFPHSVSYEVEHDDIFIEFHKAKMR